MVIMARQDLKSVAYTPMYLQWKTYVEFLLLMCVAPGYSNLLWGVAVYLAVRGYIHPHCKLLLLNSGYVSSLL
jgi:hypothetical protein